MIHSILKTHLVRPCIKQIITQTPKQRRTQRQPRCPIVKLWYQRVQINSKIVQNLKLRAQRTSHITIHGSMSHFLLIAILSVVCMQSIQLGSKLGGNSDNALGSSSGLLANNIVAALVANVDTVIFLELMMFPKEVGRASSLLKQQLQLFFGRLLFGSVSE